MNLSDSSIYLYRQEKIASLAGYGLTVRATAKIKPNAFGKPEGGNPGEVVLESMINR